MGSFQSSFTSDILTPLFTPDELAAYDISDSKKAQYKNFIPTVFGEFQTEYKIFCDKRKKEILDSIKSNINNENLKKIRKDINILIIIGSSFRNQRTKKSNEDYQKSAEDLDMALLIRHLFHFSFGISYDQILITSTQNSDFSLIGIDEKLISIPEYIFKEIQDIDPISKSFLYDIPNVKEFMLEQNINLAQIKDKQYKFYIDGSIENIVNPFNINVILKKLPKNPDSDLFVFLLDHEHRQGFGELPYQFIIERLLKIECKRFFVFNDSYCSGSIIKIIDICWKFKKIFPDIENLTLESSLFYFMTNLNKVYSNDEQIAVSISDKINNIDSYSINAEMKNILKSMILKIDKPILAKISEFVFNLEDEFKSIGCSPQQIIQFSEKAAIFASSDFDQISLTLPGRKFKITSFVKPTIRVFGSIFSSILIETFLNIDENATSLDKFGELIYNKYGEYGNKFQEYIKEQNKIIEGQTLNTELPKEEEIAKFFSPTNYKNTHYYTKLSEFPELHLISLGNKYWNVDITKVNPVEYNDVKFSMINKINQKVLGQLTPKQLAQYDIPNANERKKKNHQDTIKLLFNQFSDKYQTLFCRRAKIIQEETQANLNDKKLKKIRDNISILIIVGPSINLQKSKYFDGKYQKDAEDLNIALLIRHLFIYAFGIPREQILITSTQMRDFKKSQKDQVHYKIMNEDEFMLYQHINLAQVGNFQYKFYIDENIKDIVKPFNKDIQNEIILNDNSNLFVFFLDHGYAGGFDSIPYQLIIECFLEIKCKNFYVFNDSCYSGSLIKLIKICRQFREIFPDIKDQNDETNFFYFLMNFNKVSPENFKSEFSAKISSSNLNESIKEYINKLLNSTNLNKVIEYLSNIDDSLKSIECIPQQFIQFSEKAAIFASSDFDQLAFTLPGRKLDISILNESTIRVFGSIFSSILIETFLNIAADLLFKENKIQKEFEIDNFQQADEVLVKKNCPIYGKFISLIRKNINSSNYQAIKNLKVPIAIFYMKNPEDYEKNAEIFAEDFNKIIPYWDEYDLQY